MTRKIRKMTAVLAMTAVLTASALVGYGDTTTVAADTPAARVAAAQASYQAWQNKALSGGGITPATSQPEKDVIRHQVMIAAFDELFKQLTNAMNLLKTAILAFRSGTAT